MNDFLRTKLTSQGGLRKANEIADTLNPLDSSGQKSLSAGQTLMPKS
jgi:hypothetical protein